MNLGEKIKKARMDAKLSQVQLAEQLGVRQKDVSRWENNVQTPNVITFGKMCKIMEASADELLEIR